MAFEPGVNAQNYPTMLDMAKRLDPDGSVATIVELLTQTNEILEDAVVAEANNITSHRTTVRTDIPVATWRRLNYGVKPTKSKTAQVDDAIGMLDCGQVLFYDHRGGNYIQAHGDRAWQPWSEARTQWTGWLWVGTAKDVVEEVRAAGDLPRRGSGVFRP